MIRFGTAPNWVILIRFGIDLCGAFESGNLTYLQRQKRIRGEPMIEIRVLDKLTMTDKMCLGRDGYIGEIAIFMRYKF